MAIRSTFQDSSEDLCQTEELLKTKAIIPKTILSSPNLVVATKQTVEESSFVENQILED